MANQICGNNNKGEDNSPKNLKDKNQQASSQKFRQLKFIIIFNWNHFEMRLLNLRNNFLLIADFFVLILVVFVLFLLY